MGSVPDGEDAAQEVFLKMKKNLSSLQSPEAYPIWINKLILHTCLDMKNLVKNKMEVASLEIYAEQIEEVKKEFLPIEYAENNAMRHQLLSAIESLNDTYKNVLILYYYRSLSYKEISEIMNITESAVDHKLRRARTNLKKTLRIKDGALYSDTALLAGVPVITKAMLQEEKVLVKLKPYKLFLKEAFSSKALLGSYVLQNKAMCIIGGVTIAFFTRTSVGTMRYIQSSPKTQAENVPFQQVISVGSNKILLENTEYTDASISLRFYNSYGERSNVNPFKCVIKIYNTSDKTFFWRIRNSSTNEIISEGKEDVLQEDNLQIPSSQDITKYTLQIITYQDGMELVQVEQNFTVIQHIEKEISNSGIF